MNVLIGVLVLATAVAQPDSGMHELARSIVLDPSYQTTPPESLLTEAVSEPTPIPLPGPGARILRWLLYAVLGVGVVIVVTFLVREWTSPLAARATRAGPREEPGGRKAAHRNFGDFRALVRDGAYGEAIHVLLLWALEDMARLTPEAVQPSLTSREIITRAVLPRASTEALRHLVRAVEISHFGGRSPTREDFEVCLSQFESLSAVNVTAARATNGRRVSADDSLRPPPAGARTSNPPLGSETPG